MSEEDQTIEEQVVEWISLVVTDNYLQMVMSKDAELDQLRTRLMSTVTDVQERLKIMSQCQVTLYNLMHSKITPVKISNQAYSIEIIQI